jgi:predicted O-linked N-acetylglucosamine transferase (SPINDLY family)
MSNGQPEQAIEQLRQRIQARPGEAAAYRELGDLQLAAGLLPEAEASYRQAIQIEPTNVRGLNNLGQLLMRLGRVADAVTSYRSAIALEPDYAIGHNNLGIALHQQGLLESAIRSYRRAAALDPNLLQASVNCGHALVRAGRIHEALGSYDRVLAATTPRVDALLVCGDALQHLGRFEAALRHYARALEIEPDCADAHHRRGIALHALHRYPEALCAVERVLTLRPNDADILCFRGSLVRKTGEHRAALDSFERALGVCPEHAEARVGRLMSGIPAIPASIGEVSASRAAFDIELAGFADWLHLHPDVDPSSVVGTSQPFLLAYQDFDNRELLSRYGALCSELMTRWQQRCAPVRSQTRTRDASLIRVGIVSAQIRDHSVYRALTRGWLEQLNGKRVQVGAFHVGVKQDSETHRAAANGTFFVSGERTLAEWVQAVRAEQLDALIFPEIGMDATTLRLASMRLAPCQIAAWGHPETTGLPSIDYYLSAELFEAEDSQGYYCERLVQLPHLGCYYEPYEYEPHAPARAAAANATLLDLACLGIDSERPVLLCPGTPFKYAPQYDEVLVDIAQRLAGCQLVFFQPDEIGFARRLRERLEAAFRSRYLAPADCLRFIPWLPRAQFFALMRQADVCLDTIGFSGFNTAMQAVECDLPAVTFRGRFMRGRLASAIMQRAGLTELIARNREEYVELAVALVQDGAFRGEMRDRLHRGKSILFRDRAPIDGLQEFLVRTVRPAVIEA